LLYFLLFVLKNFNIGATIFLTTGPISNNEEFLIDKLYRMFLGKSPMSFNMKPINIYFRELLLYLKYKEFVLCRNRLMAMGRKEGENFIRSLLADYNSKNEFINSYNLPLKWNQIQEMFNNGFLFGAHTTSHYALTRLSPEEAFEEIERSKLTIEENLKTDVNLFAYPYGSPESYNSSIKDMLRGLGFKGSCSTNIGFNDIETDPLELKRVPIRNWRFERFRKEVNRYFK